MKRLVLLLLVFSALPALSATWYVRPAGGNRNSSNVPFGMCTGAADVDYPGTTTNLWSFSQVVALNYTIVDSNGDYEKITTAGTTGAQGSTPSWPAHGSSGATTNDGSATWTSQGAAPFNQACAVNDFRYMWSDNSGTGGVAWIIAGGDTVVIRGCRAQAWQSNPSGSNCRVGYDGGLNGNFPFSWCPGTGFTDCTMPAIPAGTSGAHTKILGQCAFGTYTCTPVNTYPLVSSNLTQLFGGFTLNGVLNLKSTQWVDVEGIEVTGHNGVCSVHGVPPYPRPCSTNPPVDDYANVGIVTDNATANVTLQDIYIHGIASNGMWGPIGANINMTRVFVGFNGEVGWSFDDGFDTPDGAGASINANYVTMMGNGCYEEYPIVHTGFPALACYDSVSNGFGDGWSGQDTELSSFHCDHCDLLYNTKDGFIGPHTQNDDLEITNSFGYGNMGSVWKWAENVGATTIFNNNLTVTNCNRMTEAVPGAAKNFAAPNVSACTISGGNTADCTTSTQAFTAGQTLYFWNFNGPLLFMDGLQGTLSATGLTSTHIKVSGGTIAGTNGTYTDGGAVQINGAGGGGYLTNFCRAGGAGFANVIRAGSTNNFFGNTIVGLGVIIYQAGCGFYAPGNIFNPETNCGSTTNLFKDNNFLGYQDFGSGTATALYFPEDAFTIFTGTFNNEFGLKPGTTDTCGTGGVTCVDPLLKSEPAQPWPGNQTAFDVFNANGGSGNSFYPTSSSPLLGAGTPITGLTTDFYATTRPNPPSMSGAELSGGPATVATPTASPIAGTYSSTQSVTLSTATGGAAICYTTNGTTPAATVAGTCDGGSTTYSGAITVAVTTTIKALGTLSGDTNSSVATFAYTISAPTVATPTASPVAGTYGATQSVTLSTVTAGASIIFTNDGSTPTVTALTCTITHGSLYTGALTVATTQTIKAIGCLTSSNSSAVFSGLYTITPPVVPPVQGVNFSLHGTVLIQH